jgi:hypothetical protein
VTTIVQQALKQLATNITAAEGIPAWVYPDEFCDVTARNLPIAIVMRRVAVTYPWGWYAYGVGSRKWEAEVFLLLHKGEVVGFNQKSATIEGRHFGWPTKMAGILAGDIQLSGLASYVGSGEQGGSGELMQYTIQHILWADEVYWGILFNVPITQRTQHEVG